MEKNPRHVLWTEAYRPTTVAECILPERLKHPFAEYVKQRMIPNLLLAGGAGVGKTTIAKAMCEEIGCDYLVINGSDESGIDVFRTKIKNYASSLSLQGGRKVIIIDEGDYLNCFGGQQSVKVVEDGEVVDRTIQELEGKEFHILSYNIVDQRVEVTSGSSFLSGHKEVFEVEFEDGTTMMCTKDHPFFSMGGETAHIDTPDFLLCINNIEVVRFNDNTTGGIGNEGVYIPDQKCSDG